MKKFMILALALCLAALPALAEADAVTSASVNDFYADGMLSGDELMDAINSISGSYVLSTVNEDGTPQVGFYIFSMAKDVTYSTMVQRIALTKKSSTMSVMFPKINKSINAPVP